MSYAVEANQEKPEAGPDKVVKDRETTSHGNENDENEDQYPTKGSLATITASLCMVVFLFALDSTVVTTAIPRITVDFQTVNDVGWYGSAYLMVSTAFQPFFGKLFKIFPIRPVYLAAIGLFSLGSLICAISRQSSVFIIGRAIAGLGGAGIFSGSLLIVASSVPLRMRPIFFGGLGAMAGVATATGPIIGGVLTDRVTWRWCFYINLPISAVPALTMLFLYKSPPVKVQDGGRRSALQILRDLCLPDTALFVASTVCLFLALKWGGTEYEWSSGIVVALFVVFSILLLVFLFVQYLRGQDGLLPLRMFRQRTVAFGAWFIFCLSAALFTMTYYVPFWFQAVKGDSAQQSGISTLPIIVGLSVCEFLGGAIITAVGYYSPMMYISSICMAIGAGLASTFQPSTSNPIWIGYLALFGIGAGLGNQVPQMALQVVLDKDDLAVGTGFLSFAQSFGGAVFTSVGQNLLTNHLAQNVRELAPDLDPQLVIEAGATGFRSAILEKDVSAVILSYNRALTTTYIAAAAMAALSFVGAVGVEWRSVKGKASPRDNTE